MAILICRSGTSDLVSLAARRSDLLREEAMEILHGLLLDMSLIFMKVAGR